MHMRDFPALCTYAVAYEFLLNYFKDEGMTEEKLNVIVGPGSILQMIIVAIR